MLLERSGRFYGRTAPRGGASSVKEYFPRRYDMLKLDGIVCFSSVFEALSFLSRPSRNSCRQLPGPYAGACTRYPRPQPAGRKCHSRKASALAEAFEPAGLEDLGPHVSSRRSETAY